MTPDQKGRHDSEYQSLLALYLALIAAMQGGDKTEALYSLAELRSDLAFRHVLTGLKIEYDDAVRLIRAGGDDSLTQWEKDMRDRLVAALNNLVNFSVCQEYQLYDEVEEMIEDEDFDAEDFDYDELIALCRKYNDTYAAVENADIEYAGVMAALWITLSSRDYLVYWTQNDSKVRPWHMALQGYTATRDEFPSWMIPPIEYNCRCFLEALEIPVVGKLERVLASAKDAKKPEELDDVFSESLCKCGKIFGDSHSYFNVKESDREMLQGFVSRIIKKYYGEE